MLHFIANVLTSVFLVYATIMSDPLGQTTTPGREMAQFSQKVIMGAPFETTERYTDLVPIGMGVSGLVCSARDQISNTKLAVKKLSEPFKSDNIAKHMFREVKLLKQLQHENVCHHSLIEHCNLTLIACRSFT